jgi:hypothetical protein
VLQPPVFGRSAVELALQPYGLVFYAYRI